jgi:hypothetical protein
MLSIIWRRRFLPLMPRDIFEDGFVEYFQKRLEDDPDEWFHTLLADTVFYDYQPTWPRGRERG